jgi:hypothetical protein
MRKTRVFLAVLTGVGLSIAGLAPIVVASTPYENNTNRPGGDYKTVRLKSHAKAEACMTLCEADGKCQAWTYVKGDKFNRPRCRLKETVPQAVNKKCCTSGVKVASTPPPEPPPPQPTPPPAPTPAAVWHVEHNVDRGGGDYEFWDLAVNATWDKCQAMCALTFGKCKAWTYAKAGVHGPAPRCYLKSTVPIANSNTNAVSGYVTP